MATAIIMPKQGQSVETCIITKWFKNIGDDVYVGDILFSYETDKAAFDLESSAEGKLLERFYDEGAEVPVLVNVAVIGKPGESTNEFKTEQTLASIDNSTELADKRDPEIAIISHRASSEQDSKTRISPRARNLAEKSGLDYTKLSGSGPNGRIIASDIERALSAGTLKQEAIRTKDTEYTEKPLSNVRKLIAKAMFSSLQNSAQLTHHMSADVRRLLEHRRKIKNELIKDPSNQDITLNDMICWCVIRALEKFPDINSHFLDDRIRIFQKVHLGIAVDTSRGLMVPVVRDSNDMDLATLSKELKSVADSCRRGSINPELLKSTEATFTVSNLGNYGVEMFTPVINLPQTGILGVCTIINRPVSLDNNTFGFVPFIGLSLTYDHRAVDGGPATLFMKEIKEQIEAFSV